MKTFKLKSELAYNPFNAWPRNLVCWCGSGRKFKKCCATSMPKVIPKNKLKIVKIDFDRLFAHVRTLEEIGVCYRNQETEMFMKEDK